MIIIFNTNICCRGYKCPRLRAIPKMLLPSIPATYWSLNSFTSFYSKRGRLRREKTIRNSWGRRGMRRKIAIAGRTPLLSSKTPILSWRRGEISVWGSPGGGKSWNSANSTISGTAEAVVACRSRNRFPPSNFTDLISFFVVMFDALLWRTLEIERGGKKLTLWPIYKNRHFDR